MLGCCDFNVEPATIPCLVKGISAGLWVDLEAAWAFASGRQPGVTFKRSWDSTGGSRRDFMVGCPRAAAAAVSRCVVQEDRWILPHLAVRAHFECSRWVSRVSQPVQRTPLWLASWLPVLDKSRGSKSAEVQRVSGIFDDRLQFMTWDDALAYRVFRLSRALSGLCGPKNFKKIGPSTFFIVTFS